jgi:hypothetical protein
MGRVTPHGSATHDYNAGAKWGSGGLERFLFNLTHALSRREALRAISSLAGIDLEHFNKYCSRKRQTN